MAPSAAPQRYTLGPAARMLDLVTSTAFGVYQTAIVRIGIAGTWLFFLLRHWPDRHVLYGPDGPWSFGLAELRTETTGEFTALLWWNGGTWFELVYHFAIATSIGMLLGWRTRTMSVLFMIGVLSVQNRHTIIADSGDNVINLMSMYLVLTRCGSVWSLDARRPPSGGNDRDASGVTLWTVLGAALIALTAGGLISSGWIVVFWGLWSVHGIWWLARRYSRGDPRTVCRMIVNVTHNATFVVILAQVCLIYSASGWYKIQGERWQDGSAVYYPLHVDLLNPWPALSDALTSNGALVLLITYGTVLVQVAFPFTLFNRRVKNVLLVFMVAEHIGIGILMGLPFFSLAMISVDAAFLPTNALRWLGDKTTAVLRRGSSASPRKQDEHAQELPQEAENSEHLPAR